MGHQIIEIAKIKLAANVSEEQLIAASNTFQSEFLTGQPGYIGRDLVRVENGGYADIVRWESHEAAAAVMEKFPESEACSSYFSVMEFDTQDPASGVSHCSVLSSYGS